MTQTLMLTFDDGPTPDWTARVIERLAVHDAKATFFVLGDRIRARPSVVRNLLAAGHRVELHGDRHLDHRTATADELEADTASALKIMAALGAKPQWWRLPWGRPGDATMTVAERHGLRIVGWDHDTHDWRGDGWDDQPASVTGAAEHGGIVLLHDGLGKGQTRINCVNTLELVDRFLEHAKQHGTTVAALPDATSDLPLPDGVPA